MSRRRIERHGPFSAWLLRRLSVLLLVILAIPTAAAAAPRTVELAAAAATAGERVVTVSGTLSGPGVVARAASRWRISAQRRAGRRWVTAASVKPARVVRRRRAFSLAVTVPGADPTASLRVVVQAPGRRVVKTSRTLTVTFRAAQSSSFAQSLPNSAGPAPEPSPAPVPTPTVPGPAAPATVPAGTPYVPPAGAILGVPAPGRPGTVTLEGDVSLAPGSFLAAGITDATPDGLLVEVVASVTVGGRTAVTVEPALLSDVVPTGSFDVVVPAVTVDDPAQSGGRSGRAAKPRPFTCSGGGTLSSEVGVKIGAQPNFSASWTWGSAPTVRSTMTSTVSLSSKFGASGELSCKAEWAIFEKKNLPKVNFLIGGIPIVITPRVGVDFEGKISTEAELAMSVTHSLRAEEGVELAGGQLRRINDVQRSSTLTSTPGVTGTASLSVVPTAEFLLYGVIGPRVDVAIGGRIELRSTRPQYKVYAVVEGSGRLVIDQLNLSWSLGKATFEWIVLQDDGQDTPTPTPTPPPEPTPTPTPTPSPVDAAHDAISVTAGGAYSCVVRESAKVACWGYGVDGRLGTGQMGVVEVTPVPVDIGGVLAVAAGTTHTCAVLGSGNVSCWGQGMEGRLGNGREDDAPSPVLASSLSDAVAISAGFSSACAVRAGGGVACWGHGAHGVLGRGSTADTSVPVAVSGVTDAIAVSVGDEHACSVRSDRSVVCWGRGTDGRLGTGSVADAWTPSPVVGLSDVSNVSAGGSHTCAVRIGGTVACWGRGTDGQLGDGTGADSAAPVAVQGISDAVAVSAGQFHTCALRAEGPVVCWGAGLGGRLGNGSTQNAGVPVSVAGLTDAVDINAGAGHTCAARRGGRTVCWGGNFMGELGNGSTDDASTPVEVAPLP